MKILLCVLLVAGVLVSAVDVTAQDGAALNAGSDVLSEFRIGIMKHDVAIRSNDREDGHDMNLEFQFLPPHILRYIGSPHPILGGAINNQHHTSQIYSGLLWEWKPLRKTFVNLGLGGAVHDAEINSIDPDTKRFATRALFRYAFTAGFEINKNYNISAMFDHISNANTAFPNNSLEKFGVLIGYRY